MVLLPVMAVVTVAVAARPSWRAPAALWVMVANGVVLLLCFAGAGSGESLQSRLSQAAGRRVADDHAEMGGLVPWFAFLLLVASAVVYLSVRRGGTGPLVPIGIALSAAAGVAAIGIVVAVGHSGASATWQERMAGTPAPVEGDG